MASLRVNGNRCIWRNARVLLWLPYKILKKNINKRNYYYTWEDRRGKFSIIWI